MKNTDCRKNNIIKGVSTLDAISNSLKFLPLLIALIIFKSVIYSAPGHSTLDSVDPNFNPQIQTGSFGTKNVHVVLPLPDGKILVGGTFNTYNRQPVGTLVRVNSDGSLDTTFNMVLETITGIENQVLRALLQSDGKILVVSNNFTVNGQSNLGPMIRLNADGTLDPTFQYGATIQPAYIAIDASDRILIQQSFGTKLFRLNTDGSLDTSFQFPEGFPGLGAFAAQGNKVIISYYVQSANSVTYQRINENGTLDSTFTDRIYGFGAAKIQVQPDNKILILLPRALLRLEENGASDDGFGIRNLNTDSITMNLSNDGKITVVTAFPTTFRRFLPNGTIDNSFTPYIFQQSPGFGYSTFGLQLDGNIIIGDSFNSGVNSGTVPNGFFRILSNGSQDTSFNAGGVGFQRQSPGSIRAIAVQADDKIIIGGLFDSINDTLRIKLARLNTDSSLDESFQVNVSGANNSFSRISNIYHIVVKPDGKMLISGNFDYLVNGVTKSNLAQLNSDGSIDTTFNLNVGILDAFTCCGLGTNKPVLSTENKLFVGTSRLNSNASIPIKLSGNGILDTTFNPNIFPAYTLVDIWGIAVQPDGKVIIGGNHRGSQGPNKSFVLRLNLDGSVDQTFQINQEDNRYIADLALLPNGKILVVIGNQFSNVPSTQQSDVLRLNNDGSIDASFDPGTSADGRINVILPLETGQIFVGGNFVSFDGQVRQNLAQLNADGSLDPVTYNVNSEVLSLAVDSTGRVLIGGNFTSIGAGKSGNITRSHMARLIDSEQIGSTRFDFDGDGRADLGVFNNTNGVWSIFHSLTNQPVYTNFGLNNDKLAPADFDGDGKTDIAIYRPSEGNWYLNQSTAGFAVIRWGLAEDIPMPGDYDGDGNADIAVWRPSTGIWYVLTSSNGQWFAVNFGLSADIPLSGADFDGDEKTDIAVWRPSDGNFYWLESGSGNQFRVVHFGQTGDIPAVGDYNGDGKTDLVVFRPSNGVWYQYLTNSNGIYSFSAIQFGLNGDEPVAADYDGDGKTDIAIRRQNVWHLWLSTQGYSAAIFGDVNTSAIAALPSPNP